MSTWLRTSVLAVMLASSVAHADDRPAIPRLVLGGATPLPSPSAAPRRASVVQALRDRHTIHVPRPLLASEVTQLDELVRRTPRDAADRPALVRRLGLVAAQLAERARADAESASDVDATALRRVADLAGATARRSLSTVVTSPRTPGDDDVLYDLARELEHAGSVEAAREAYFRVLHEHPRSRLTARTYLALGMSFATEAGDDLERLELGELCLERAIAAADDTDEARGLAHDELARARLRRGAMAEAQASFAAAARWAMRFGRSRAALSLGEAARADAIAAFARASLPEGAEAFASAVAGRGMREGDVLDRIGAAWLAAGRTRDAATLFAAEADEDCRLKARRLHARALVVAPRDRASVLGALTLQAREASASGAACARATLEASAAVAASLHRDALFDPKDDGAATSALEAYDVALSLSPASDAARWAGADTTLVGVALARGQLLFRQKSYLSCTASYELAGANGAVGDDRIEAARGALACARATLGEAGVSRTARSIGLLVGAGDDPIVPSLEPISPAPIEEVAIRAFDRFLAEGAPTAIERTRAAREVGALHFAHHAFAEAAARFEEAAFVDADAPDLEAGLLHLEALDAVSRTKGDRLVRLAEMDASIDRLVARGCPRPRAGGVASCTDLSRARLSVRAARATALMDDAARGGRDAGTRREAAARLYWETARSCALELRAAGRTPLCAHPERLLERSADAFQAAHLTMKAIRVRTMLLERSELAGTVEARRSPLAIAKAYESMLAFDEAAAFYERYARDPNDVADGAEAARTAVRLRLALGHDDAAIRDATLIDLGNRATDEPARAAVAVAVHHAERGEWESARARLASSLFDIDRRGDAATRLIGHALHARALAELARDGESAVADRRVLASWTKVGPLAEASPDDRARAMGAVAEASLRIAARLERRARNARPDDRIAAYESVEQAYARVSVIGDAVPARWLVAAAARSGAMWASERTLPTKDTRPRARAAFETCLRRSIALSHFDDVSRSCELWLARTYKGEFHVVDELAPTTKDAEARDRPPPVARDSGE